MTKRVVISANTSWYLYNFRLPLILELRARGYEVVCVASEDQYTQALRELNIRLYSISYSGRQINAINELVLIASTFICILRLQPNIVLSFTMRCNIYFGLVKYLFNFKFIPNVSGLGNHFASKSGWLQYLKRILIKVAFSRAKTVIVQNNHIQNYFVESQICPANKISKINGSGVDTSVFKYCAPRNASKLRIAMISRLIRPKGIMEFIEASKRCPFEAEWFLVGQLQTEGDDKITAEDLDIALFGSPITFLGTLNNMQDFLKKVDVVVLPTYYPEGIPKIILESISCGKIVITTDTPGCNETLIEGNNGFFCEPKSYRSIILALQKIQKLNYEQRTAFGVCSRQLAENKFDLKHNHNVYFQKIEG